ncbi:MAG TPA: 30S ribosomal protein S8e [Candidatus Poseidoniales archaeon]|jgi:small subunit ribosomal protein S8e|nr:MAG: 30S ribosomal protein S8e [Euryarchaeota archaeon]HIG33755.1 30S ribosomal protein S8e [Candidatus Poseidoniales archaeon]HIL68201.1 30S ribosomal protein S8e [Candidatus Poseidoniales archaeon]
MAKWHGISRRKPTGGRLKRPSRYRGKRRTEVSSEEQLAFVGETDSRKSYRKRAGSQTVRILSVNQVNVNTKDGKTVRATVKNVVGNDADPNYVRRNIVTKGAVLETDKGLVRVTSRPGMHGVVSGVLVEE